MKERDRAVRGDTTDNVVAPERLAALLDGRLSEQDRVEALKRLAESPNDVALLAEATAVLREMEEQEEAHSKAPARVREHTPQSQWTTGKRRWIGAAAAIAVVAGGAWFAAQRMGGNTLGPARYVAMLADAPSRLPAGWNGQPWSATRGNPDAAASIRARAVRLGARLVDLQVAVTTSDSAVSAIAADIAQQVSAMPASALLSGLYADIARRAGESPASLQPAVDEAAKAVRVAAGASDVDLGSWLEAGRLAAARGDGVYFRQSASRAHLEELARSPELTAETRATAERVRAAVASRSPAWNQVADDLAAVLAARARGR